MTTPTLTIDPKFKGLIPALTPEEYAQLEANLLSDGVLDPIKVWSSGGIILDGHNRYAIAKEHGLDFKVISLFMPDREAAENWIDENQLGRRNLAPDKMALIRGRIYNRAKKATGRPPEKLRQSGGISGTAPTLASKLGVSPRTLERDGAFADAVEALDLVEEVTAGIVDASREQVIAAAKELPPAPTPKQQAKAREKVDNPAPKPTKAPPSPKTDDREARIAQLEALLAQRDEEIKELVQALEEANFSLKGLTIENEALVKAINADDPHAAIMAENDKCRALARVTEERARGVQNRNKALAKTAESWMRKFQKLEKKVKGMAADPEPAPDPDDFIPIEEFPYDPLYDGVR